MPRLIVRNGTTSSVTYTLGGDELLRVESVSADIDASAVVASFFADVIYRDANGSLIARSRAGATVGLVPAWLITWAPSLPDSVELNNSGLTPILTTGLADTVVPPNGSVTVSMSDPAAIVTQARLWVDNVSDVAGDDEDVSVAGGRWAFVPGPGA